MKHWRQALFSAVVVLGAGALVLTQLTSGTAPTDDPSMEGHDHAAMTAAGEQQPVRLAAEDARRIGVTFAPVERRVLDLTVEALGTVAWDETRLATVNPRVEGWVEELHVDYTGAPVRRGDPLLSVYSPQLVSAQEELLLAVRLVEDAPEGRRLDNARTLLESSRRRLEYWNIPADAIRGIEESGQVSRTLTLRAPASGIVVEKHVVEGDRIAPGMELYRIADLSGVWIEAEVFEKDLALVREGLAAVVTFEAFPGRTFPARVTYVHPTVSMDARTGRVRLELANDSGDLRPGMYARVRLSIPAGEPTLVVPRSAVLATGTRSLVFVRSADGTLVPRTVVSGRTVDRDVEILEGLEEGEQVVSSAAFLVDAESSLGALTGGMDGMDMPEAEMPGDATGPAMDGMNHDGMNHDEMNHDEMNHEGMNHEGMNHEGGH